MTRSRPANFRARLSLTVALALAAPGTLAAQLAPAAAAGCYDVEVGMWRAVTDGPISRPALPPDVGADSTAYVVPPRIRLTTEPGGFPGRGWYRIATPPGALPTEHRYPAWEIDGDRLLVMFSTGMVGVHGVVTAQGDGFAGSLRTFHDVAGTQSYERSLTLRRVDCATPPPVPDSGLRRLPRSVELAGGIRLALGEDAPKGVDATPRPSGALGLEVRSEGLFAGSDSVAYRIGRNDGKVGVIQLIYPAPAEADSLIARITRQYGDPDPNTSVPGGWWHNRVTQLSVIPYPEGGYRVLLQDPRSW